MIDVCFVWCQLQCPVKVFDSTLLLAQSQVCQTPVGMCHVIRWQNIQHFVVHGNCLAVMTQVVMNVAQPEQVVRPLFSFRLRHGLFQAHSLVGRLNPLQAIQDLIQRFNLLRRQTRSINHDEQIVGQAGGPLGCFQLQETKGTLLAHQAFAQPKAGFCRIAGFSYQFQLTANQVQLFLVKRQQPLSLTIEAFAVPV